MQRFFNSKTNLAEDWHLWSMKLNFGGVIPPTMRCRLVPVRVAGKQACECGGKGNEGRVYFISAAWVSTLEPSGGDKNQDFSSVPRFLRRSVKPEAWKNQTVWLDFFFWLSCFSGGNREKNVSKQARRRRNGLPGWHVSWSTGNQNTQTSRPSASLSRRLGFW
jgi:hypothetical protein